METLHLSSDQVGITQAVSILTAGGTVAFPTETVYGLGADATNSEAIKEIYRAKSRPINNPLICHYLNAVAAFSDTKADERAYLLARAFWPGPLTLILPRARGCRISPEVSSLNSTLAVRVPASPTAIRLLQSLPFPLAAPSANLSGHISPTLPEHVLADLDGRIHAVLFPEVEEKIQVGLESTIIDLTGPVSRILRPGGISCEQIAEKFREAFGQVKSLTSFSLSFGEKEQTGELLSPGMLSSHYAPQLPVRLNAFSVLSNEALLAFGPVPPSCQNAALIFNLSEVGNMEEAASNLFKGLWFLEKEALQRSLTALAVMPVPEKGIGVALNDRLKRAAFPKKAE